MSGRGRRGGCGQRTGHAQDPGGGGRRRARPGAGIRHPQLVLRVVQGRRLPLVRAGRELGGAPVEHRCQGARRRALQPGADARPGHRTRRELHSQGARVRDDRLGAQAHGQDQAAGSPAVPAAGAAIPHAGAAGSRGGAQGGAAGQEGGRPCHRGTARGGGERLRGAHGLRHRLRRQLPAPRPGDPHPGKRHRRGHRRFGLGALARARQSRPQQQRPVDPVGPRRGLRQALHGREHRHVDRRRDRERQGARRRHRPSPP